MIQTPTTMRHGTVSVLLINNHIDIKTKHASCVALGVWIFLIFVIIVIGYLSQ